MLGVQSNFPNVNALVGVNVRQAQPREFPYIVSFMLNTQNPQPTHDHICTGSLITRSHVLIAEHCTVNVLANETIILAGTNNLQHGRVHRILWWINYNEWAMYRNIQIEFEVNDMCIIKVNYSLFIFINILCLFHKNFVIL
jgi:hypothetical protein